MEVWQLPSPATPALTAPVRVAGLRGRNLELVEHRGALPGVAGVQPERALGARADPLHHRGDPGDAAVRPGAGQEAEVLIELVRREVVREQPRVDVRRVDDREPDVLPRQVGLGTIVRAGDHAGDGDQSHSHEATAHRDSNTRCATLSASRLDAVLSHRNAPREDRLYPRARVVDTGADRRAHRRRDERRPPQFFTRQSRGSRADAGDRAK